MRELGLPENHPFGQGDKTYFFVDCGWVMVHRNGQKWTPIFPPEKPWREAWEDLEIIWRLQ